MDQSNVSIAEGAVDAFNARDAELFASMTSSDFEWFPSMIAVEGAGFRGSAGVARYFETLESAWDYFRVVAEHFVEGDGLVLLLGHLEGRGRNSGARVESELGMAFDLRDGLITRIRGYLNQEEALVAVGLADCG